MKINKWLLIVLLGAALVGFADSAYLTSQHIRGIIPPCGLLSNCDTVLSSKYASIGPIPVAALGILYYSTVIILLIVYFDISNRRILHWVAWLVSAGLLASLYFIFLQVFIIGAFCLYCLLSAASTFVMFVIAIIIMRTD